MVGGMRFPDPYLVNIIFRLLCPVCAKQPYLTMINSICILVICLHPSFYASVIPI